MGRRSRLLEAVRVQGEGRRLWLHLPAHRGGEGASPEMRRLLPLALDLTELPGLDDLAQPRGVIRRAEEEAARLHGADRAFFLVGGSTVGIQAAVLATVGPGEILVAPRFAHRSLAAALVLSGARPRFILPEADERYGVPLGVDPEEIPRALEGAAALLWVDPTYQGVAFDLENLAAAAHARGIPFIVDAAHGAAFGFHPELPRSALAQGADLVVLGMHKSGGSLTQTALLLVRGGRVSVERLAQTLRYLQTSSPSYLLLFSLEAAVRFWEDGGREALDRSIATAKALWAEFPFFRPPVGRSGVIGHDPTRLLLRTAEFGFSGPAALERLRALGVEPEYADPENVLFCLGLGAGERVGRELRRALRGLGRREARVEALRAPGHLPTVARRPREAFHRNWEAVEIRRAVGRILAADVTPYPPGSPALYPGEILDEEWAGYLLALNDLGLELQGVDERGRVQVLV